MVELVKGEFEYGTPLDTIITINGNKLLPYIDDPDNEFALLEGYFFKGYSLVPNSDILISNENYIVRGADTLWTVFEYSKTMNTLTHPDWFTVVKVGDSTGIYTEPDSQYMLEGVFIKPISPLMGGKITIPTYMTYEGVEYPVISIEGCQNTKLTHVFMEDKTKSKLLMIAKQCFFDLSSLIHFDFDEFGIRYIGDEAFRNCSKLNTNSFGNKLYYIGEHAFTSALDSSISVINIPSTVVRLQNYAVANNLENKINNILNIGSDQSRSVLLLSSRNGQPAINSTSLKQANGYSTINFWTTQYSSGLDKVSGSTTVASWFANNGVLAKGGSVFVNGV